MIKKHFASVCAAIVAVLTFTACCIASCNAESITSSIDDEVATMEKIVKEKEAELDSLDSIMPLSDTVGETDTYCDMRDAFDAFQYSRTIQGKRKQFRIYVILQHDVVEQAKEWMNKTSEQ